MIQPTQVQILTHDRLHRSKHAPAATRVAAGVMRVERDSNALRRYAVTFAHLGKLNPITELHLRDLIFCFRELIRNSGSSARPVVLGLAESGIVPSYAMHCACQDLELASNWFCTTRSPSVDGLHFAEPHSHAPHHFLPPAFFEEAGEELWIVEDEITTGATLNNLLSCLDARGRLNRVRIFSLLDTRDSTTVSSFNDLWRRRGIQIRVDSLMKVPSCFWEQDWSTLDRVQINSQPRMYYVGEAIATGLPLLLAGKLNAVQQITRSPWTVDGVNIFSRQEKGSGHYLYNAQEISDA